MGQRWRGPLQHQRAHAAAAKGSSPAPKEVSAARCCTNGCTPPRPWGVPPPPKEASVGQRWRGPLQHQRVHAVTPRGCSPAPPVAAPTCACCHAQGNYRRPKGYPWASSSEPCLAPWPCLALAPGLALTPGLALRPCLAPRPCPLACLAPWRALPPGMPCALA